MMKFDDFKSGSIKKTAVYLPETKTKAIGTFVPFWPLVHIPSMKIPFHLYPTSLFKDYNTKYPPPPRIPELKVKILRGNSGKLGERGETRETVGNSGNLGKLGETQANSGKLGESRGNSGNSGNLRENRGNSGKLEGIWGNSWAFGKIWRNLQKREHLTQKRLPCLTAPWWILVKVWENLGKLWEFWGKFWETWGIFGKFGET